MAEERVTCAKLAVKYELPQWVVYQIAHRLRFNQILAHYKAACDVVNDKGWEPAQIVKFFNEFDVYHIPVVPRHARSHRCWGVYTLFDNP